METFAFIVTDLIWGALTLIGVAIIIFVIIHFIKKGKLEFSLDQSFALF